MIVGEKTLLCGLTKNCSADILQWVNAPELKEFTGTVFPVSEFEHEKWLEARATSKSDKLFLIKDRETNAVIGTIGLKNIDYINRHAELFISIGNQDYLAASGGKDHVAKRGYGGDAVKALTNFCFDTLNLHKVYLHVFESNARAIRCYEKIGFTAEGRLREHHFSKGCYETVVVMSKLSGE